MAIQPSLNAIFEPRLFTPLTAFFMVIYYWLWQVGQPYMSSRFFALDDVKSFKKVVIYTIIFTTIISGAMWAGCAGRILFPGLSDADAVVPMFIKTYFPTYMGVLAIIGILAAILTTVSSILITVGTTVGYDLVEKCFNKTLDDKQTLKISQLSTFIIGGLALVLSLLKTPAFLSLLVYAALGGMACMVVGPVVASFYDKKATKQGATAASISATALFLLLLLGLHCNVWESGAIGMITSIVATIVISRLWGKPSDTLVEIHQFYKSFAQSLK